MTGAEVRAARADDAAALRGICLRTGDAGGDATGLHADADLLGLVWAQPYLDLEPAHAFVATVDDEVVGYVLGTPTTAAFEDRAERVYWPTLRLRYPLGAVAGRTPADEEAVGLVHAPPTAPVEVAGAWPGHLHVDLLPQAQGQGLGRRLVATELGSLADVGCPAVHVGVDPRNWRALAFYRRLGFVDAAVSDDVVHLGRTLGNSGDDALV